MYIKYNLKLKQFSKDLRNKPTRAEIIMWDFLRNTYPKITFLRQKPLDEFIVDFCCLKLNLIVENDGEVHSKQKERDRERDNILFQKYNLKTIRFTNDQVENNKKHLKEVLDEAVL